MSNIRGMGDVSRRRALGMGVGASLSLASGRALAQQAIGQPLIGNPALPEAPQSRMRWAIVGLGTFAVGQVIPGFASARQSRMTAFVSGNRAKAEELGSRY
ncbi:MAG: oxidoreductase, partial [Erythrobacter sp.]|nr:oxidoreductase [Erythrobacter sp.]